MPRKRKQPQMRGNSGNDTSTENNNNNGPVVQSGKLTGSETYRNGQVPLPMLKKREAHWKDCEDSFIFPRCTPWLVFLVTLIGRVVYVSQVKNWWILHPDEVFQSVEVAFSELHGYGFRAYEFLPPPESPLSSSARQQEANLGMHSLRSFLYPRVFVLVMLVGDWLGMKPFLVAKVFHAAVTSTLPLATYFFTSTVFHCHDIASLSSILVAFSVHLTVFGTHTLMNSFFAPIVLLCLVPILKNFLENKESEGEYSTSGSLNGTRSNGFIEVPKEHKRQCNGYLSDETPRVNNGMAGEWNRPLVLFLSGLMLGVTCYIRIDLGLFLALIIAPHCLRTRSNQVLLTFDLQVFLPIILGFVSGMLLGGLEDSWSYGVWFLSPYQWLRFNVGFDFATLLFGKQDLDYYLKRIVTHNFSLVCLSASLVTVLIYAAISHEFRRAQGRNLTLLLKLFIPSVFLFIIYTLKGHKEMRFVHNPLVLLIIVYSSAILLALKHIFSRDLTRTRVKWIVYLCVSLYIFNQWRVMPTPVDQSNKPWVYNSGWDSNHVNDCFDFIGQQSDVRGVFVDRSIHTSAAFSVLRQDVPLLSLIHYELYEFGTTAYLPLSSVTIFGRKDTVNVRTLSSISNYISIYNSHEYLLKLLLKRKDYNYLVMKKEKTFINRGYEQVYSSGTMKVLRRTFDKGAEEYLAKLADSLPIGTNATILEYEGSWLLTFGLLQLAEERLLTALQLGNPTARLFQILVKTFLEQNKFNHARKAEQLCIDSLGLDTCRTPQPRIILHEGYDIQLPGR
ncbi:uncharacterized protein LOC135476506 [Liolophura sinensis]|uniref:uncharacterized protein LOC135476506 n=1 Tax=Liolophura sinensis TaxID=3198878 RepID=UPI003159141C